MNIYTNTRLDIYAPDIAKVIREHTRPIFIIEHDEIVSSELVSHPTLQPSPDVVSGFPSSCLVRVCLLFVALCRIYIDYMTC